jgi:hypothetical protein
VAVAEGELQVSVVTIVSAAKPLPTGDLDYFAREQMKDLEVIRYLDVGELPADDSRAHKLLVHVARWSTLLH